MHWFLDFLHLLAVGVPGWLLFRLLRVPAPIMMGAMLSAGFFAVKGWGVPQVPLGANLVFQIILGLFIGVRFTREAGAEFKKSVGVALLAGVWWITLPLGLGWFVSAWFGLDLPTSILGTVPGGIAEMSIMALSMNANAALVALMQFFRVTSVLIGMPLLSIRINRSMNGEFGLEEKKTVPADIDERQSDRLRGTVIIISLAIAGGLTGTWLGFPAGGFVGAMAFTGAASAAGWPLRPLPLFFRHIGQLGLGALIGLNATPEIVEVLWGVLLPTLGVTILMLGWGIILAFMVRKIMGWNLITCLIATCPGGITQLASIADELGADPLKVSLLHLVRLFTIFLVLPPLIKVVLICWG
ncbi:MAG: AbrB family transcriptional regulator [Thermovirgaceae bacterium]|nr:AbrB family transcriptional regulator [Thermovirgaceae bacterium]